MLKTSVSSAFKARRDRLMKKYPGSTFLFPANAHPIRNDDVHYEFRQDSSFYYLTGYDEPMSFAVLAPRKNGSGYQFVLFVYPRDPEKELWEGEHYGMDRAKQIFGADEAYPIQELENKLPEYMTAGNDVFYRIGLNVNNDRVFQNALEKTRLLHGRSGKAMLAVRDPREAVGEMRLFKDEEEVKALRRACEITALAHKAAMEQTKPGMMEFEVQAILEYTFKKNGCMRNGYGSIVAAGKNATCLHYHANNDRLNDGDVILLDAAGEFDYYSSDITRTYPVGKTFTKTQAAIYDLVLKSQKSAISICKPGLPYADIHNHATEVLVDGLLSMGLMKGDAKDLIKDLKQKRLYPHGTGHYLGLDVHDSGLYRINDEPRRLEAGMCFTIEPGLYFQSYDQESPPEYRGLGIRIEDDILITPSGHDVLTKDCPKERSDVEAIRSRAY